MEKGAGGAFERQGEGPSEFHSRDDFLHSSIQTVGMEEREEDPNSFIQMEGGWVFITEMGRGKALSKRVFVFDLFFELFN